MGKRRGREDERWRRRVGEPGEGEEGMRKVEERRRDGEERRREEGARM